MSKGYLWFAQNNDKTDYVKLSISLAESIKTVSYTHLTLPTKRIV